MKKCIIFGGNGFIGSHLAEALLNRGYQVKIFSSFNHGTGNLSNIIDKITIIKGNFLHKDEISSALEDVDTVFHYITTTTPVTAINCPIFEIETNIIGSINLFQAAIDKGVEKIVYPSSGGTIYGLTSGEPISENFETNPINPYAISKLTIERYLEYYHRTYGVKYTIFRYSNPYGERQNPLGKQGIIPVFLYRILCKEHPLVFGDGSASRDYIYIKDAVDATLAVLESDTKETTFNIGSGQSTSILDLLRIMQQVTGRNVTPKFFSDPGGSVHQIVLDISRIKRETGWSPSTKIDDGISKTWHWISDPSSHFE